jgi:hypothetical protein
VPRSVLLDGIVAENADAARAQVWTFDHATVIHEIGRRVPGLVASASRKLRFVEPIGRFIPAAFSERAPDDPTRHARDDNIILPITSTDWRAAKLSRLLSHFDLRRASTFSEVELLDLCLEAEARAVELMTRLAGPGQSKRGETPFEGTSVVHLAQYVLRLFRELDEGFAVKPPQEQERIAADIAKLLSDLPAALQERIREEADLADLSAAALKKTGAIAAVGGALVGTVGIAGFAAYTTFGDRGVGRCLWSNPAVRSVPACDCRACISFEPAGARGRFSCRRPLCCNAGQSADPGSVPPDHGRYWSHGFRHKREPCRCANGNRRRIGKTRLDASGRRPQAAGTN